MRFHIISDDLTVNILISLKRAMILFALTITKQPTSSIYRYILSLLLHPFVDGQSKNRAEHYDNIMPTRKYVFRIFFQSN